MVEYIYKEYDIGTSSGGYYMQFGTNDGKSWIISRDGKEEVFKNFSKADATFTAEINEARKSISLYGSRGRVSGGFVMPLSEIQKLCNIRS